MQRKESLHKRYNVHLIDHYRIAPMPKKQRKTYYGPTLLSYGFRPFFLLALIFGATVIPLWVTVYTGIIQLNGSFSAIDWHIHEMLFGYAAAVICGFLFTAIPNWTGRMPVRGWPLGLLVGLWIAGRFAMAGIGGLRPAWIIMAIDNAFLFAVCAMIVTEIIAGRNWRNLKVVIPVLMFLTANIIFHLEVITQGTAVYGRRLGFAVVVFLITLIGGRIIPSFTRNWLVKFNPGRLPIAFNRFDAICILSGIVALVTWVITPETPITSWLLGAAALLHTIRLLRWCGYRTVRSPILLILHIAYIFIPVGLATLAIDQQTAGLHLLGIGAIGGMTTAVIIRASLGHTGRALHINPSLTLAFTLIMLAAIMRSVAPDFEVMGLSGIEITAILWTTGFIIMFAKVGPWLWTPKEKPRRPNKPA
jgi:uncharacterized protein involved in response to NO